VLGLLVFPIVENIGMSTGIMPVTGIPLPFLSYGGSATVVDFVAVGLVVGVGLRLRPTLGGRDR
jgi:rod shape determining protein RodA